jgi:hypothetical protein
VVLLTVIPAGQSGTFISSRSGRVRALIGL